LTVTLCEKALMPRAIHDRITDNDLATNDASPEICAGEKGRLTEQVGHSLAATLVVLLSDPATFFNHCSSPRVTA